jgi:hypothetical protein
VNIDGSESGRLEHPIREDLAVGNHDNKIGPKILEHPAILFQPNLFGLIHRYPVRQSKCFDGSRLQLLSPADRTIRLREDATDFVGIIEQFSESRDGKLRSAQEDDSH